MKVDSFQFSLHIESILHRQGKEKSQDFVSLSFILFQDYFDPSYQKKDESNVLLIMALLFVMTKT